MEILLLSLIKSGAIALCLAYLVFIWFETHFVIEYFSWCSMVKSLEWGEYEKANAPAKYPHFLREKYNCWFTRMVGCPFCLIGFIGLTIFLPLGFFIGWWGSLTVAPIAAVMFLVMELLYKKVYS